MAKALANPHNAVPPNFALPEFEAQRQVLTDGGVAENEVVALLTKIWSANNNRERAAWVQRQTKRKQAEEEEAQRRRQAEADLLETARLEERRKNKAKYNPIRDVPVPSGPIVVPFPSAQAKMWKGSYCELWYFTNSGLRAAEKAAFSQDDPDYIAVRQQNDDSKVFIIASAAELFTLNSNGKNDAHNLVPDEDLSWEEIYEAFPRIIVSMKDNDWAEDRVQMFDKFWTAIREHPWRHAADEFSQEALRTYQAQQRKRWHFAAGTVHSWSLAAINQDVLYKTRSVLIANAYERELAACSEVSLFFFQ